MKVGGAGGAGGVEAGRQREGRKEWTGVCFILITKVFEGFLPLGDCAVCAHWLLISGP